MDTKLSKEDIHARMDLAELPTSVVQQIFALSEGEFVRAQRAPQRLDHKSFALLAVTLLLQGVPTGVLLRGPSHAPLVLGLLCFILGSVTLALLLTTLNVQNLMNLGPRTILAESILSHLQTSKVANPLQAAADYQRFVTIQLWEIIQRTREVQVKKARLFSLALGCLFATIGVHLVLVLVCAVT